MLFGGPVMAFIIDRNGGNKNVPLDSVLQKFRRQADNAWGVATGVNGNIPAPALQGIKFAVSVACECFDRGEQVRV